MKKNLRAIEDIDDPLEYYEQAIGKFTHKHYTYKSVGQLIAAYELAIRGKQYAAMRLLSNAVGCKSETAYAIIDSIISKNTADKLNGIDRSGDFVNRYTSVKG